MTKNFHNHGEFRIKETEDLYRRSTGYHDTTNLFSDQGLYEGATDSKTVISLFSVTYRAFLKTTQKSKGDVCPILGKPSSNLIAGVTWSFASS